MAVVCGRDTTHEVITYTRQGGDGANYRGSSNDDHDNNDQDDEDKDDNDDDNDEGDEDEHDKGDDGGGNDADGDGDQEDDDEDDQDDIKNSKSKANNRRHGSTRTAKAVPKRRFPSMRPALPATSSIILPTVMRDGNPCGFMILLDVFVRRLCIIETVVGGSGQLGRLV